LPISISLAEPLSLLRFHSGVWSHLRRDTLFSNAVFLARHDFRRHRVAEFLWGFVLTLACQNVIGFFFF